LEEKFAPIPLYGGVYPLGWQGTREWLADLGRKALIKKESAPKRAISRTGKNGL